MGWTLKRFSNGPVYSLDSWHVVYGKVTFWRASVKDPCPVKRKPPLCFPPLRERCPGGDADAWQPLTMRCVRTRVEAGHVSGATYSSSTGQILQIRICPFNTCTCRGVFASPSNCCQPDGQSVLKTSNDLRRKNSTPNIWLLHIFKTLYSPLEKPPRLGLGITQEAEKHLLVPSAS